MLDLSKDELQATLQQLDQSIYNHEHWVKDLTRTIICRLSYDQRDVAEDAHRQCRFGQWYYGSSPAVLREHPSFKAIEIEHRRMHQCATRLLLAMSSESLSSSKDYDSFLNAIDRLQLEIWTLKHEIEESLYHRDHLTGAENRINMLTRLRELRELVKRQIQQCGIVIMDLDHFKAVNDNHGHLVGDQVLAGAIRHIRTHLRPYDQVYRYGGEEFLFALPSPDLPAVQVVVERMREGLGTITYPVDEAQPIFVTASFGIALLDPDASVEDSIGRADAALYAAKTSGRNRACVWDPSMALRRESEA